MGFLSLFNLFKVAGAKPPVTVRYWLDDYRLVELLSVQNLNYLQHDMGCVNATALPDDESALTAPDTVTFKMPVPTISLEIRFAPLDELLSRHLSRAQYVQRETEPAVSCATGDTKVYTAGSTAVFVEVQGEFVKHIWLRNGYDTSNQLHHAVEALYQLGETYNLLLVNWSNNEYVNLTDRRHVESYLRG
jgi:hypothetical protein